MDTVEILTIVFFAIIFSITSSASFLVPEKTTSILFNKFLIFKSNFLFLFPSNLKSNCNGYDKTILELDIEGCLDNISHEKMISLTVLPGSAKKFLRTALEAGVLHERDKILVGRPQGGILSYMESKI